MEISLLKGTVVTIRRLLWLAAAGLLATAGAAEPKAAPPGKGAKDFMPFVELAPFVVNGKQLAISVYARSKGDRRYAETFAEEVVKVVYESVTESTGKGLVIIGKKGEPHPVFVFRKFLALAKEGKLDPAVAAREPELYTMLDHWQDTVGEGKAGGSDGEQEVDVEFEKVVTAMPLPLEGIGAKLYQLAWAEDFNEARVEAKLKALHAADLEGNMFARFDWVFYLPPRGAFEQAIDDIIADALKEEKAGMFERAIVKGAMMMVKPSIRRMVEGMRRSVMFSTVVQTRAPFGPEEVSELTSAYMDVLMNEPKGETGTEHERAVKAIRAKVRSFEEKPKPEEAPKPAEEPAAEVAEKP
jgi:hypothetical protein